MDNWVSIKIPKSLKTDLETGIRELKKEYPELNGIKISLHNFIERLLKKWRNL